MYEIIMQLKYVRCLYLKGMQHIYSTQTSAQIW